MLMTTSRLICLRVFNLTLGKSAHASAFLRKLLVHKLVLSEKQGNIYSASSQFYLPTDLSIESEHLTPDESINMPDHQN